MTIVDMTVHPYWVEVVFSMSYFSSFLVKICEFKELYFDVLVGVRGGWPVGIVAFMHSNSGCKWASITPWEIACAREWPNWVKHHPMLYQ